MGLKNPKKLKNLKFNNLKFLKLWNFFKLISSVHTFLHKQVLILKLMAYTELKTKRSNENFIWLICMILRNFSITNPMHAV